MQKIVIDLLPIEFKAEVLKKTRFYKVQILGIGLILFTTFLTSLTIVLRLLQSQQISQIQNNMKVAEQKVSDLKSTQASLLLLKNRLVTIDKYLDNPSRQSQMYNLIERLLPASASISTISIDKSGDALVLASVSDGFSLDYLIDNLISKETNEDKIKQVSIESLSRGRDGIYRLTFKVKQK